MPQRSWAGIVAGPLVPLLVGLLAAAPAGAQARRPRPVENVRVLKGWDGDQVRAEMRLMTAALGVKCEHCHVQGNFASDEKRTKIKARQMIEMTMDLNAEFFTAAEPDTGAGPETSKLGRVTCYTCHQGAAVPKGSGGYGDRR